jgi:hypothetical protein
MEHCFTFRSTDLRNVNYAGARDAIELDHVSPNEFRTFIDSRQKWFENLKDFRDSLAHRIPLYIPPFMIRDEDGEEYATRICVFQAC